LFRDWAELLEPVRAHLVPHQAQRLSEADATGFAAYLAMLRAYPNDGHAPLIGILDRTLPAGAKQEDKEALARQQAQAAVALLHLGRCEPADPVALLHLGPSKPADPETLLRLVLLHRDPIDQVLPLFHPSEQGLRLFHQTEDPTRRTYLIHRCA